MSLSLGSVQAGIQVVDLLPPRVPVVPLAPACTSCRLQQPSLAHAAPAHATYAIHARVLRCFLFFQPRPNPPCLPTVLHFRSRARNLVGRCALSPTSSRHFQPSLLLWYLLLTQSDPSPRAHTAKITPSKRSPASTLTRASPRSSTFSTSLSTSSLTPRKHSFLFCVFDRQHSFPPH